MVEYVYDKGRVTTRGVDRAFKIAAVTRRTEMLTFFLKRANVTLEALELAFRSIIRMKSFGVATLLYSTRRIPLMVLNQDFEKAASVDVINFLFNKDRISAKVINRVFEHAVNSCIISDDCGNRAEIVKLLCTGKKECIAGKSIKRAFSKAANSNSVILVKTLCTSRFISRDTISKVVLDACAYNHLDIVKALCNNRNISPELGARMLVRAIQSDFVGVANFLWGQAWIPYEKFMEVFFDAAKNGCLKTVEWFCRYNRASRASITVAFLAAAEEGHDHVARVLYGKQQASPEAISALLMAKHASKMQHFKIVNLLLEKYVPRKPRRRITSRRWVSNFNHQS